MIFDLATTPNIIFGNGQLAMLPKLISQYGNRALLITGKSSFENSELGNKLYAELKTAKIEFKTVNIENEPSPRDIDQAVLTHRQWSPQVTIGIGGGSVIDAGKAISAMLKHELPIKNYLEDVGTQKPNGNKVPFVAVPTTSGTGSEATKNAVITQAGKDGFKKSLRHNNYVPNIALIDPLLTVNCPPKVTAASGMDAFTQLLESYLSTNSNPITDALALDGITRLAANIETAYLQGNNIEARSNMSYAALISGITLANAGLGLVHGFAQPLGSIFNMPHGIVCGTLMGAANRITIERIRKTNNLSAIKKYHKAAIAAGFDSDENKAIDQFIDFIDELTLKFKLPKLSDLGIEISDFEKIIGNTGLKYHPEKLSDKDLYEILKMRL